ncbi:hypothetical protein [Streptomyces sp. NRRL F-2580]|uniref:hypothetical protein n=1 Tax=Streptomyces sp. NRRL F-2580 TaxID=1463841 RepID=UPI000A8C88E6|nr:hypothetical protein [Streptomyces sp. NRRL F-2580]
MKYIDAAVEQLRAKSHELREEDTEHPNADHNPCPTSAVKPPRDLVGKADRAALSQPKNGVPITKSAQVAESVPGPAALRAGVAYEQKLDGHRALLFTAAEPAGGCWCRPGAVRWSRTGGPT